MASKFLHRIVTFDSCDLWPWLFSCIVHWLQNATPSPYLTRFRFCHKLTDASPQIYPSGGNIYYAPCNFYFSLLICRWNISNLFGFKLPSNNLSLCSLHTKSSGMLFIYILQWFMCVIGVKYLICSLNWPVSVKNLLLSNCSYA